MKFVRQLKPKLSDDAEVTIFYQDKLLINNKNQRFIHPCSEFKLFFDINDLISIAVKNNKTRKKLRYLELTKKLFYIFGIHYNKKNFHHFQLYIIAKA